MSFSTLSCQSYILEKDCKKASAYCSWDSFSLSCRGSSSSCYSDADINAVNSTEILGDPSFLISNNTCSLNGCQNDDICLPNDKCERTCYNSRLTCMQSNVCLESLQCVEHCDSSDMSCYDKCRPGSKSPVDQAYFDNYMKCFGSCKFNSCGAGCLDARDACVADSQCLLSFNCMVERSAHTSCDKDCFSTCAAYSTSDFSTALFYAAFDCIYKSCDPYLLLFRTCDAISSFDSIPVPFQRYMCQQSTCLGGSLASPMSTMDSACSWSNDQSNCFCDYGSNAALEAAVCGVDAASCFGCCSKKLDTCQSNNGTTCQIDYNNCTSACNALLYSAAAIAGKTDVSSSLGLVVGSADDVKMLTPNALRASIFKSMNFPGLNEYDVFVTGVATVDDRRRSGVSVTITFFIRIDSSGAASIVAAITSSQGSGALLSQIQSSAGVTIISVSVTTPVVLVPTVPPPIPTTPSTTTYTVTTIITTLLTGDYLTSAQINYLVQQYITAYSLDPSTPITVSLAAGQLSASFERTGVPPALLLAPKLINIEYTLQDGSTASVSVATHTSTYALTTRAPPIVIVPSSTSSATTYIIIGASVGGGVTLLVVIAVILVLRSRKNRCSSKQIIPKDDPESQMIFVPQYVTKPSTGVSIGHRKAW